MAALPPLVTASALADRLGATTAPVAVLDAAVADASTAVRAACTPTWVNDAGQLEDVPPAVEVVVLSVARRLVTNPDGLRSEQVGAYLAAWTYATHGPTLTREERRMLRPWLRPAITSAQLVNSRHPCPLGALWHTPDAKPWLLA